MTDGKLGEIPDWYRTLKAAQALGVPPWELADRPLVWQEWALTATAVEADARKDKDRREARRRKTKRK